LTTNRLILRDFVESDWRAVLEYQSDPAYLRYSPRPHTLSARSMPDDVSDEEKKRRHEITDEMQAGILAEINARTLGQTVPVLVEENLKGRWRGRTPQNKLVFFEDEANWKGKIANVEITWTGPWSMQGRLLASRFQASDAFPIPVFANDNAQNHQIALKS